MTIMVVGGIDEEELFSVLEENFGDWKGKGELPRSAEIDVAKNDQPIRVILFDFPGSQQSNIVVAQQISEPFGKDYEALELANIIFGGTFSSRINANLREDKGWSYGVRSYISKERGPRNWTIGAQVQTDKTAASILELLEELNGVTGDRPFTLSELESARNERVRGIPGITSSYRGILSYMRELTKFDHPDEYIESRKTAYHSVKLKDLEAAFSGNISSDDLIWFIAGDLAKIETEVRALDLGPIEVWNAEGKKVR